MTMTNLGTGTGGLVFFDLRVYTMEFPSTKKVVPIVPRNYYMLALMVSEHDPEEMHYFSGAPFPRDQYPTLVSWKCKKNVIQISWSTGPGGSDQNHSKYMGPGPNRDRQQSRSLRTRPKTK